MLQERKKKQLYIQYKQRQKKDCNLETKLLLSKPSVKLLLKTTPFQPLRLSDAKGSLKVASKLLTIPENGVFVIKPDEDADTNEIVYFFLPFFL